MMNLLRKKDKWNGYPVVAIADGVKIYSDKKASGVDGDKVTFTDGSWCKPGTGEVYNKGGRGYVGFGDQKLTLAPETITQGPTSYEGRMLVVNGLYGADLKIEPHEGSEILVTVVGPQEKIDGIVVLSRNGAVIIESKSKTRQGGGGVFIQQSGSTLTVRNLGGNTCDTHVKVLVPFETSISITDTEEDVEIGNVGGKVDLKSKYSGEFKVKSATEVTLDISGSGDVTIGGMKGILYVRNADSAKIRIVNGYAISPTVVSSGSGDIIFGGNSSGDMEVEIQNSGAVSFGGGQVDTFKLGGEGSGDFLFEGEVLGEAKVVMTSRGNVKLGKGKIQSLNLDIGGSGDFACGPVLTQLIVRTGNKGSGSAKIANTTAVLASMHINGSGDLVIEKCECANVEVMITSRGEVALRGGEVRTLKAVLTGSGDFAFGGNADYAELSASSNGEIRVKFCKNQPKVSKRGSGDITVGNWR